MSSSAEIAASPQAVYVNKVGPKVFSEWVYEIDPTDSGCRVTETWIDGRGARPGDAHQVNDRHDAREPQDDR